jgi:hypothetical protein
VSRSKRSGTSARSNERELLARSQVRQSRQPSKNPRKARRAPDPRIQLAWRRAAVARRAFGVAAVVGFGAVILLARTTFAGHAKQAPRPLSAPTNFVQIVRRSYLQAGIIAPAQAPPGAATAVS